MQLSAVDLAIIVIYLAMLPLVGIYAARRQKTAAELFPRWSAAALVLRGQQRAGHFERELPRGAGGDDPVWSPVFHGYRRIPLVIPVVTRLVLPIVHALPITSVYKYLERRFAPGIANVAEVVFVLRVSLWMAIIVYTASMAVAEVTSWNVFVTIAAVGLITTAYTTFGGFDTVVWTDNLQTLTLLIGAVGLPFVVWNMTGLSPVAWWDLFSQADRTHIELFSFDPTVRMTLFAVIASQFFWTSCLNVSDQVIVQRWLATPSLEASRRSVWVAILLQMLVVSLLAFCGLALFATYLAASRPADGGLPEGNRSGRRFTAAALHRRGATHRRVWRAARVAIGGGDVEPQLRNQLGLQRADPAREWSR